MKALDSRHALYVDCFPSSLLELCRSPVEPSPYDLLHRGHTLHSFIYGSTSTLQVGHIQKPTGFYAATWCDTAGRYPFRTSAPLAPLCHDPSQIGEYHRTGLPRFHVRLFGDLELLREGQPVGLGRNERRLLAFLALSPSKVWPRKDIAAALWPDVEFAVSGNRLRTTLVALRKAFQPIDPVGGDAHSLLLDWSEVETDLERAQRLRRRIGFASDPAEDAGNLDALLELLEPGLALEIEDEWIESDRREWSMKTLDALHRRAELAFQMENYEVASAASERALLEHPSDDLAWSLYLRSMAKRNLGAEAYRRFSAVRKHLISDSMDLSPQLIQLAKSVRDGALSPVTDLPSLEPDAQDLVLRAFRQMLALNAVDAMRMVTTDSFRLQLNRNPAAAIDLLESIIDATEGDSAERVELHLMAMRAHYITGHSSAVFELSDWLLARELTPFQRRTTLMMRSFHHFLVREYDLAFRHIDEAIASASWSENPHQLTIARSERASYLWHAGEDEQALAEYLATHELIKDEPEEKVGFAPAALSYNVGTLMLTNDRFAEARPWLERSVSFCGIRGYSEILALVEPSLGYNRVRLGEVEEGLELIISGLTRCFRNGNQRSLEVSLDMAAAALASTGKGSQALGLIAWCRKSRQANRHAYSVCETRFVDKITALAGDVTPDPGLANAKSSRAALEIVFGAMQP